MKLKNNFKDLDSSTCISLIFKSTECNGWPKIKLYLNNDLYQDHEFKQEIEQVNLPIYLEDGKHLLEIEIYDKKSNATIVDQEGKIIQDQLLELKEIRVNNVKLPEYFLYSGNYKISDNTYPQSLIWGCNGVWSWNFEMPLVSWAVKTKQNHEDKYNNESIDSQEIIKILIEKLNRINKTLNQLE